MSDATRASMEATLADICSKPSTPNREAAKSRIRAGLAKMSDHAGRAPRGGDRVRAMTTHDSEHLMKVADDANRSDRERDRAKQILAGDGDLRTGDVTFLDRTR